MVDQANDYAEAFYDVADMLGIGARADSPANVWRNEIRPKMLALLNNRVAVDRAANQLRRYGAFDALDRATALVDQLAAKLAAADGLSWDEVCGFEAPDSEDCNSSTCIAAHYEDHEPDVARANYRRWSRTALAFAKRASGWQPVKTAPKDGSPFLVFIPDTGMDFAQYDIELGEFCKWGCGWQYVTHWHPAPSTPPIPHSTKTGGHG